MQTIQGEFNGDSVKIAIVSTRWNDDIVDRLVEGAIDVLTDCGVDDDDITVVRVPGAFELPLAVDRLLLHRRAIRFPWLSGERWNRWQ